MAKLFWSEYHKRLGEVAIVSRARRPAAAGGRRLPGHPVAERFPEQPGRHIFSGTSQIQRNIIGERALGLPKEPADRALTGRTDELRNEEHCRDYWHHRRSRSELRDSVRRFLADQAPLKRVRELMETQDGPTGRSGSRRAPARPAGLAIPEEYGGAGFSFAEQAIVLEEMGAALYGGPTWPARCWRPRRCWPARTRRRAADLLPGIASGETIATLAFTEDDGSWDPDAIRLPRAGPARAGCSTGARASCSTATRRI